MNIYKNVIFLSVVAVGGIILVVYFWKVWTSDVPRPSDVVNLPTEEPSVSPSPTPSTSSGQATPRPIATKAPLPTGDGRTTFIDEAVPWSLLLGEATCRLQGEIKFLDHNTYDNQDAKFIYNGVDHPGRNIFWTVTPQDEISVGPNIFGKMFLPNGESLIGIALPENPKSKQYELTVRMHYGRLVDEKDHFVTIGGNVKVFEKQCDGKTTIVLP
ncbi:MAG: hypothetical protein HYX22_00785 [Candidatus Yanofskybacteria bacterium]|nr:hypothetical protein [Candidatus Yanofskybacteria bacterium]